MRPEGEIEFLQSAPGAPEISPSEELAEVRELLEKSGFGFAVNAETCPARNPTAYHLKILFGWFDAVETARDRFRDELERQGYTPQDINRVLAGEKCAEDHLSINKRENFL